MTYTRYDLKRRKKNNVFFIVLVMGILALSFISGSIISNMVIKKIDYKNENISPNKEENKKNVEKNFELENTFVAIQCGVFTNKDNAKALKEKLSSIGTAFIIEEEDKSRVIMGIYTEQNSELISIKLSEIKMDFSKIKLKVISKELCDIQVIEIIDAYLQINNKFFDNKVKSVQTKQLKEWIYSLKEVDKVSINYEVLQKLKEEINMLPDYITKAHLEDINIDLFTKINQLK